MEKKPAYNIKKDSCKTGNQQHGYIIYRQYNTTQHNANTTQALVTNIEYVIVKYDEENVWKMFKRATKWCLK